MKNQMKKYLKKAADIFLQLLFPRRCPGCDSILKVKLLNVGEPPFICRECEEQIQFPSEPRCLICSRPISDDASEFCPECQKAKRFFDKGVSLMVHDDMARKIIYGLKYKGAADHADFLGYELGAQYKDVIMAWGARAIIPIPLHKKRYKQRGYNQAELIAKALVRFMGPDAGLFVDTDLVVRNYNTQPLKTLDGNMRANNIRKAFKITEKGKYESVILVDDIYTTGATLNECAKMLKRAGVKHVFFLTASIVS